MIGIITIIIALSLQIGLLIYRLATKNRQTKLKHILRIASFIIFSLSSAAGIYWWGFRWMGLFILLAILAIFSVIHFVKKPKAEKQFKSFTAVLSCINWCIFLTFMILPGILFPQLDQVGATGPYTVDTTSITFVDASRTEPFSNTGENRKLTVQFWYPAVEAASDKFPLAIFSHGSFGYRGSNLSTFSDLASNGYVVCSIDHSYHAFFSQHDDGSVTPVNMDFLNDAVNITNDQYDEQTTYDKTHEWLDLRTSDMDFILDCILSNATSEIPKPLHTLIDQEKIGLFGHSLGGAAAAQLARERTDVDAVIVVDGTMIGEEIAFEDGQGILSTEAYPVPLLNMYNDSHYEDAKQQGTAYNNFSASSNAIEAYDIVIRGSGHLNFTDLPLFSPALAGMLGTGDADARYCIETMNQCVLRFFNYTLKDHKELQLQSEY